MKLFTYFCNSKITLSFMNCNGQKNPFIGIILLCTIFFVFFLSCKNKAKVSDDAILFDTIQIDETQPWQNGDSKLKISCRLHISFIYPNSCKDSVLLHKLQSEFIERTFSMKYAGLSPQQAVDSFKMQYFTDFQGERFSEEDYDLEDESGFQYHLNIKNTITYNGNNLVSFLVETENFEGGAHGSHSAFGYVVDLHTGDYISEDSFAGEDYKKNLSEIIVNKIAEANKVTNPKQLEDIGYNSISEIVPNGNFTIDEKGMTYYFNEYEIAAYVIGITKIFIPYDEMKLYLTDGNPITPLVK